MTNRSLARSPSRGTGTIVGLLALLAASDVAWSAPTLRFQTDLHGDIAMFGNSLGFDCRAAVPDPTVGTVDRQNCYQLAQLNTPAYIDDSSADVFWRAEDSGLVSTSAALQRSQARSAAVLQIPVGATVAYARLYWSSLYKEDNSPTSTVTIDRPGSGGFSHQITVGSSDIQATGQAFQGTADITALLQKHGAGVYRVGGFAKAELVDRNDANLYAGWGVVVVYKQSSEPLRHVAVYDGLTAVSPGVSSMMQLRGFAVPQVVGASRLGVIAYEGDAEETGDALKVKGIALTDGSTGGVSNLFNSSRTTLGQAMSVMGDLPQMTGAAGSMSGLDLDILDLTTALSPGETWLQLDMLTGPALNNDQYYIGALVSSVVSKKPIIETILTVPAGADMLLPGDVVEYTATVRNVGEDGAKDLELEQKLPANLSYVAGSTRIVTGPGAGNKTDAGGDDEAEFDAATGVLRIRIGNGASGQAGGTLATTDAPIVVRYQLKLSESAVGEVPNQIIAIATPESTAGATATTYPSSASSTPNQATVVTVRECANNFDCTASAPVCDLKAMPHRCTDACMQNNDCKNAVGGKDLCGAEMRCVQCTQTDKSACTNDGIGGACLPTGLCGCASDADCGGRRCDLATNLCPKPSTDLAINVSSDPEASDGTQPLTAKLSVSNVSGGGVPSGIQMAFQVPMGGSLGAVEAGLGWRCTPSAEIIRCTYNRPLAAGTTTPEVKIKVTPTVGGQSSTAQEIQLKGTVSSEVSTDPNPANNEKLLPVYIGQLWVAGGGFSCQMGHGGEAAGTLGCATMGLLWVLLRARRRDKGSSTRLGHN